MTYAIPATEVRNNMAKVLAKIQKERATCLVTQRGRGVAALLPLEVYNRMVSDFEDWLDEQDEELAKEVECARREYREGKFKTLDQIFPQ